MSTRPPFMTSPWSHTRTPRVSRFGLTRRTDPERELVGPAIFIVALVVVALLSVGVIR